MLGSSRSHRFIHAAGLACALVFSGCGTRVTFVATHEPYEAWKGHVRILHEMPSYDAYIELGILVGQGRDTDDWSDVLRALQKEGKKKGANAIVLIGQKEKKHTGVGGSGSVGLYEEKTMMAKAIRILD